LQTFIGVEHVAEKFEEADEIRLAGTVGPDENIQTRRHFELLQFANRFISSERNLVEAMAGERTHEMRRLTQGLL
jgi:kynureninase